LAKSVYSPLFVALAFQKGLQYRISDLKTFICDDLASSCKKLVNFDSVTPESKKMKCGGVQIIKFFLSRVSSISKKNSTFFGLYNLTPSSKWAPYHYLRLYGNWVTILPPSLNFGGSSFGCSIFNSTFWGFKFKPFWAFVRHNTAKKRRFPTQCLFCSPVFSYVSTYCFPILLRSHFNVITILYSLVNVQNAGHKTLNWKTFVCGTVFCCHGYYLLIHSPTFLQNFAPNSCQFSLALASWLFQLFPKIVKFRNFGWRHFFESIFEFTRYQRLCAVISIPYTLRWKPCFLGCVMTWLWLAGV